MARDEPELSAQLTALGERLEVRVTSAEGEARSDVQLPPASLYESAAQLAEGSASRTLLEAVGKQLYACLTAGEAGHVAEATFRQAQRLGTPVHIQLRFDPDQTALARLPWETIVDDLDRALIRDGLANITRYITYPQAPPSLSPAYDTDTLLMVVARPRGLPKITVGDPPPAKHLLTLDHGALEDIERILLIERTPIWGVHFLGHGDVVRVCQCRLNLDRFIYLSDPVAKCPRCGRPASEAKFVGVLAFEQERRARYVTAQELGAVLYNSHTSFAMLQACESASVGGKTIFTGLAPALLLAGVPAVIGMQHPVTNAFANRFARNFYTALFADGDIAAAMYKARRLTTGGSWYSPVLYLRQQPQKTTARVTYRARLVDTAAPAQVRAGHPFLARLWIRRPETPELNEEQLRSELGLVADAPLSARSLLAELQFALVEGRAFRRGEVQVRLDALDCAVEPSSIRLFIDEHLDAPPAIFVIRPLGAGGTVLLRFSVSQDGGIIASSTHLIAVLETPVSPSSPINTSSFVVPVHKEQLGDLIVVGDVTGSSQVAIGKYIRQTIDSFSGGTAEQVAQLLKLRSALSGTDASNYGLGDILADRARDFVGREHVFRRIDDFLAYNRSGYLVIDGVPGIGKSAILAEYVRRTGCIAHFYMQGQGLAQSSQFLAHVCAQLIADRALPYMSLPSHATLDRAFLEKLLHEAVMTRPKERLVIAVDALDEAVPAHPDYHCSNPFCLPPTLPDGVYFIMTTRRATAVLEEQATLARLDLMEFPEENRYDAEHYLHLRAEYPMVRAWIERQQDPAVIAFVRDIAHLSQGNFLYLRYLLAHIESGRYQDRRIDELPVGLEGYYRDHWVRAGMQDKPLPKLKIHILYLLSELRQPVSVRMLHDILIHNQFRVDVSDVQAVVREWSPFLERQEAPGGERLSVYHTSFRDFLNQEDIVQAAGISIKDIHELLANYLWANLVGPSDDR